MAFFDDAMSDTENFLPEIEAGKPFGLHKEAYVRKCYPELLEEIKKDVAAWKAPQADKVMRPRLVEIRGSCGIGKSVFLAYLLAACKKSWGLSSFGVFHSPKTGKARVDGGIDDVLCTVYINNEVIIDKQQYGLESTRIKLDSLLAQLDGLFYDGCSMSFSLESFFGIVFVSASPSLYTKNLQDALFNYRRLCMPTWSRTESIACGKILGIDDDSVRENYDYMNGIIRYAFQKGRAKQKLDDSVIVVSSKCLCGMVATQQTDKETEKAIVHALVRWEPPTNAVDAGAEYADQSFEYQYDGNIRFELVSRYAEARVAQKLYTEDEHDLKETSKRVRSLPGAAGYGGALFEAYAVRHLLSGPTVKLDGLEGQVSKTITMRKLERDPLVLNCNTLSTNTVPYSDVLKQEDHGTWTPCLVWPTTNNFPTFDVYYFHTDGIMYALQMTTADKEHELKNGGAHQTLKYFEGIPTMQKPYHAVFVVPEGKLKRLRRQAFVGKVLNGKNVVMEANVATSMMEESFDQWIMEI